MSIKKNSYILITGGAGYIGSHINKLLNSMGYRTVVFDNLINGHRDFVQWGEFVEGDLADSAHSWITCSPIIPFRWSCIWRPSPMCMNPF